MFQNHNLLVVVSKGCLLSRKIVLGLQGRLRGAAGALGAVATEAVASGAGAATMAAGAISIPCASASS